MRIRFVQALGGQRPLRNLRLHDARLGEADAAQERRTGAGRPAHGIRQGTTAYDADYAGAGTVMPAANRTDLLMFYHAENHLFGGTDHPVFPFYASVGLARSSDGGLTWKRQGAVITAADPQQPAQDVPGAGALTPTAIVKGDYIYVLYREIDPQSKLTGLAIARNCQRRRRPGHVSEVVSGIVQHARRRR